MKHAALYLVLGGVVAFVSYRITTAAMNRRAPDAPQSNDLAMTDGEDPPTATPAAAPPSPGRLSPEQQKRLRALMRATDPAPVQPASDPVALPPSLSPLQQLIVAPESSAEVREQATHLRRQLTLLVELRSRHCWHADEASKAIMMEASAQLSFVGGRILMSGFDLGRVTSEAQPSDAARACIASTMRGDHVLAESGAAYSALKSQSLREAFVVRSPGAFEM